MFLLEKRHPQKNTCQGHNIGRLAGKEWSSDFNNINIKGVQFKQETSKIEGLDPAIQQYLDQRFDRIEEMLEKILKRMD